MDDKMNNPWENFSRTMKNEMGFIKKFNDNLENKKDGEEYEIKTENLIPEPFIGNPLKAKLILLNLNPGYKEGKTKKQYKNKKFSKACEQNLKHNLSNYPFYYLNPEFQKLEGCSWWKKRLEHIVDMEDTKKPAENIANIEFFPYHSKKSGKINTFKKIMEIKTWAETKLESQKYNFYLVRQILNEQKENKNIIIMRSEKLWLEAIPQLAYNNYYILSSTQNNVISYNNLKKRISEKEFERIKNIVNNR